MVTHLFSLSPSLALSPSLSLPAPLPQPFPSSPRALKYKGNRKDLPTGAGGHGETPASLRPSRGSSATQEKRAHTGVYLGGGVSGLQAFPLGTLGLGAHSL